MLLIPPELLQPVCDHAAADYPRECCGLLLGRQNPDGSITVTHARPAKNLAPPGRLHDRYDLEPLEIVHADRFARDRNLDIVGVYHSHPDHPAVPSSTDTSLAWEHYVYLILTVTASGVTQQCAWQLDPATRQMHELPLA